MSVELELIYENGSEGRMERACFAPLTYVTGLKCMIVYPSFNSHTREVSETYFNILKTSVLSSYLPDTFKEYSAGVRCDANISSKELVNAMSFVRYPSEWPYYVTTVVELRKKFPNVSSNIILFLAHVFYTRTDGTLMRAYINNHAALNTNSIGYETFVSFLRFKEIHKGLPSAHDEPNFYGRAALFGANITPIHYNQLTKQSYEYSPFQTSPILKPAQTVHIDSPILANLLDKLTEIEEKENVQ